MFTRLKHSAINFGLALTATLGTVALADKPQELMQAIEFAEYGPAEVLRLVELPRPQPAAGELRIRVEAAGVNPVDWKIRNGSLKHYGQGVPAIPGFDVAGVVDALGEGVSGFKPGDEVFALLPQTGAYAEYALAPVDAVARKPEQLSFAEAAAVPTAAVTAWRSLVEQGQLKAGQTVLIHGAPGGVGHYAVQIAHHLGARVIGTGSEANRAFVMGLGADVYVDYRSQRFEDFASEVDLVLDSVGGETLQRSYGVLRDGGVVVSIVQRLDPQDLAPRRLIDGSTRNSAQNNAQRLQELARLVRVGALRSEIQASFPLAQAVAAHQRSETGHARGKLVLTMGRQP